MVLDIDGIRKLITDERRTSERLVLPVKIFYSSALWYPVWTGPITVDDVGGNGLKFTSPEKIDRQAKLKIKIIFPGKPVEPIVTVGDVVWTKAAGHDRAQVGIRFHKMSVADRRRYVEFICDNILLKFL
jgi:hypothetical protein